MLIWRPRLRPLMLAGAVVLHAGIGACLGMWTFALIMLVGCASFLPQSAVSELLASLVLERSGRRSEALSLSPSPQTAIAGFSPPRCSSPCSSMTNDYGASVPWVAH